MLSKLLAVSSAAAELGYPTEVPLADAELTALIGFSVVFLGITFLILIVWAVGKIMNKTPKSAEKPAKTAEKPIKPAPAANLSSQVSAAETDGVSEETVAVITAAIMAYYNQNNPKCEFTVKRIKRI
ncbi:MAG: OadG family protein [Clostridia bacterium]|nr:OadG family protein [Clostridia bacterium]